MVNLRTYELRLIAEKRGIKDYKKMSREELLRTFDKSERFIKTLSQNGHERIAKIQNLSENEIKQVIKMQNLLRNELKQIAKKRGIKKNKNISKEGLLISLLKSEQSIAELRKSKSNSIAIEEIKRKFNMLRNNFSKEKIKEIRKKFYKKENIDKYFREQETKQEEREKKHYTKESQKVDEF